MKFKFIYILPICLFALTACGSGDSGSVSKGHREAIKIECNDDPDPKLCGLEVRQRFLEDGNEFVDFEELNKDQINRVKMDCFRSQKYGLETYNNCIENRKIAALEGTLTEPFRAKKPKNNIESLEKSVVMVLIVELPKEKGKEEIFHGMGSGVILDKKLIATNCHVALGAKEGPNRMIWVNNVNDKKKWSVAKIYKEDEKRDICILKHTPVEKLNLNMDPIRGIAKYSKLRRGDFVRSMGNPGGMIAHTAEGSIQFLGKLSDLAGTLKNFYDELIEDGFDENTKIIVHGAKIAQGSSGGPLFDKDGRLIGLNTLAAPGTAAENITVSADHIKELLGK